MPSQATEVRIFPVALVHAQVDVHTVPRREIISISSDLTNPLIALRFLAVAQHLCTVPEQYMHNIDRHTTPLDRCPRIPWSLSQSICLAIVLSHIWRYAQHFDAWTAVRELAIDFTYSHTCAPDRSSS